MTEFDREWSDKKLEVGKCRNEASQYIYKYLPNLGLIDKGLVVDVGCGSGEFLNLCRDMGHDILGVDAPRNDSQMGQDYIDIADERRRELGIPVREIKFMDLLSCDDGIHKDPACCVNFRGSIEQCLSPFLIGVPHVYHHDCKKLDWIAGTGYDALKELIRWSWYSLGKNGVLMIAANGTKSTDKWYSDTICEHAENLGFELEYQQGFLLHSWVKV